MATSIDLRGGGVPTAGAHPHPLDNAVWAALDGPHALPHSLKGMGGTPTADRAGRAARYPADVYDFAALADPTDPAAGGYLLTLVGPGTAVRVKPVQQVPDGWEVIGGGDGVQLVATEEFRTEPAPEAVTLGPDDVPEILDLVARTRPGPFLRRTVALGACWGRLRLPGWTEISAVCTDPGHRGKGLATRLIRAVGDGARARGDTPFLHPAAGNAPAIRLYESLGFTLRRRSTIVSVRTPGTSGKAGAF
ncbi:GNAT family N-acetyltransferase [Streptomyces sp. NPDC001858]